MGKINNIDMLNSIREQQNLEYQALIPKVSSQDDCLQVLATFESYPTAKNAFINTLTNRIGKSLFFDKVFNNPYKMFHKGMLPFGKSVEQLFVEMAEQKNFADHFTGSTTQEGDLIRAVPPSVKVDYISQNYQYKFKTSKDFVHSYVNSISTEQNTLRLSSGISYQRRTTKRRETASHIKAK